MVTDYSWRHHYQVTFSLIHVTIFIAIFIDVCMYIVSMHMDIAFFVGWKTRSNSTLTTHLTLRPWLLTPYSNKRS